MKPPRKKRSAMNFKKAAMKVTKKTAMKKCRRRNSHASGRASAPATKQASASRAAESSCSRLHDQAPVAPMLEPDTDFWIVISNVHEKSAYEDIIRVLFEKCGKLRGQFFQFDSSGYFQGTIYVAFERREEAKEAVTLYHNNITLFGKTWKLQLISKRKRTRFCEVASSSSTILESCDMASASTRPVSSRLRSSTLAPGAVESSSSIISDAVRRLSLQDAAAEIGVSAKVLISNIDAKVPSDFIELLFEKIGILRSYAVHIDSRGQLPGTAQVVYERTENAVTAVKHFANNVAFFGNTWGLELVSNELYQPPSINDRSTAKGKQKVQ